jgi:hypothetical protein
LKINFLFRPIITLNWSQIVLHSNNVFEFSTIEPLRRQLNEDDLQINDAREKNDNGKFEKQNIVFFLIDLI